jgi:acylphosphatase
MNKIQEETFIRLHTVVHGKVQGVGFRFFIQKNARALFLTGWVRNTRQGNVEVVAEGPQYILDRLLMFLKDGPRSAKVTSLETNWEDPTKEYSDFKIRSL